MARRLTRDNHQRWVAWFMEPLRGYDGIAGQETKVSGWSESIGNVYWHFDRPKAAEWFRKTLDLRRSVGWEPNWLTSTLLWKLGDEEGLRAECRRIIEIHEHRLKDIDSRPMPKDDIEAREVRGTRLRTLQDIAMAYVFARDFEQAKGWSEKGVAELDARATVALSAIRDIAGGVLGRDLDAFYQGMMKLRSQLDMWPSAAGDIPTELYRYGLALAAEHFGPVPPEFEADIAGPSKQSPRSD